MSCGPSSPTSGHTGRAYLVGLALVVVSNFFATLGPRFHRAGHRRPPSRRGRSATSRRPSGCCSPLRLAGGVARYGMRELLNSGSRRVETDLRDHLYRHLQRMSAEFYDRYPTGDVMARTTNDLLAVRMVAGPALMYLVDTTIRALLIAPAMLAISPRLTLLALVPLLGLPVAMVSLGQRIHRRSQADPGAVQRPHQPRPREPLRACGWSGPTGRKRAEIARLPPAERRLPRAESQPGPGAGAVLPSAHPAGRAERA